MVTPWRASSSSGLARSSGSSGGVGSSSSTLARSRDGADVGIDLEDPVEADQGEHVEQARRRARPGRGRRRRPRTRRSPPTSTPRPIESRKVTPSRSTTTVWPGCVGGEPHERVAGRGTVARSSSPANDSDRHAAVVEVPDDEIHGAREPIRTPMRADVLTLLAELAGHDRLVHVERIPARSARFGELAAPLPARGRGGVRRAGRCGPTRPRPSTTPGPGARSWWPRARRRASRSCYQLPDRRGGAGVAAGLGAARVPDQGAGPGPAPVPSPPSASTAWWRPPTTATPAPRPAPGCGATPTWCSPTPRCSTARCCPFHGRWANFLGRLRYVVVDELHTLRGIFGSHTAHLLRRLRRLCAPLRRRRRRSCSRRPRSASRPAWPSELCGLPVVPVIEDALAARRAALRPLEPAAARRRHRRPRPRPTSRWPG